MMMRINEEKILKMIRSNGEFIEEDYWRKGRGLVDYEDQWGEDHRSDLLVVPHHHVGKLLPGELSISVLVAPAEQLLTH
jgi:hypothetical protein